MDITGSFETHITLGARDLEPVFEYARGHGLKVTHIVLGEGRHPSQPMLTRHHSGRLPEVLAEAHATVNRLKALGVETLRVKRGDVHRESCCARGFVAGLCCA